MSLPVSGNSDDARFVVRGVHPTRDATIAAGATATVQHTVDVDGDGRDDELLIIRPAPNTPLRSDGSQSALAIACHKAQGWITRIVFFSSVLEGRATNVEWLAPLRIGGKIFPMVQGDGESPDNARRREIIANIVSVPRDGPIELLRQVVNATTDRSTFTQIDDNHVLVTSQARRPMYAVLSYENNQLAMSDWSRRPPASAPPVQR